jgi:DNA-binding MarR family transcriptional regulator
VKRKGTPEACAIFERSCVAFNLRKCSTVVSRIYQKEMRGAPVKGPLFSLMATISRRGPSTITALAEDIGLDRTTLTRNLRHLEQRGLIRVVRVTASRNEVSLLPKGEVALQESMTSWRRAQEKVLGQLGETRWDRMRKDLRAVMMLELS